MTNKGIIKKYKGLRSDYENVILEAAAIEERKRWIRRIKQWIIFCNEKGYYDTRGVLNNLLKEAEFTCEY